MSIVLPIIAPSPDFISNLLREQQTFTVIERFSSLHDQGKVPISSEPAQARYYRDLLPASPPGSGQQFAFQVDLDKCSGCKACVVACHTMNGLQEDEAWRRVGTVTSLLGQPRIQHVTTACHHCVDPGCLNGCPVKAYDKDPVTGIVRHLDDQCIGCKYCTMMCPYEIPKYSDRLGIVRKCDMCHQRLANGEAPACVQACPNEAIAITIVDSENIAPKDDTRLAPGAPESAITRPTTVYCTSQEASFASAVPQDVAIDRVAEGHWPLVTLLVTTQASVGLLLTERILAMVVWTFGLPWSTVPAFFSASISLVIAGIGLNLGALHLGQPLRAWRVFLGLRTSWLSREAVVLGKYMGLLSAAVALMLLQRFHDSLPAVFIEATDRWVPVWLANVSLTVAASVGALGLYCSAMIYVVTRRQLWRASRTFASFGGSAMVGGFALAVPVLMFAGASFASHLLMVMALNVCVAIKLCWEYRIRVSTNLKSDSYDLRSRRLVMGPLKRLTIARFQVAWVGMLTSVVSLAITNSQLSVVAVTIAFIAAVLLIAGEFIERLLYFSSVVYDKMPGTIR